MKTHKDLDVWKDSIKMVVEIYRATQKFPKEELFGLVQQLRRAAISVPSNISEGAARNQKREFIRFLRISTGSLAEVETQLFIAKQLLFIAEQEFTSLTALCNKIRSQISGLIKKLETQI
ncbi:MAG: four helix bundle protein [Bacteroidetes bacterium]|nr:four helix bundle protein [Bacteroidota bacterium]